MPSILSLFSGCGGFDLGAIAAGHTIAAAYDFDGDACAAYERLTNRPIQQADLNAIDPHILPDADGIIAGPPCQDFSIAGGSAGADGARNLFPATLRIIAAKRPAWALFENVPGLVYSHPDYFDWVLAELRALGYVVRWRILNAADFGVPQTRRRVFIAARLGSAWQWAAPTHAEMPTLFEPLPWVGWGTFAYLLSDADRMAVPRWVLHRWPSGADALFSSRMSKDMRTSQYRLCARTPDQPAFTMTTQRSASRSGPIIWQGGHYELPVSIAAAFQSLPYVPGLKMAQVGNAVPPLIARHLLASL